MSTLHYVHVTVLPAAFGLLPSPMESDEAWAMMLAIGLLESRFSHRRQVGGPANGFWQFERDGGVRGVLEHRATRGIIRPILDDMLYDHSPETSYIALPHNDILAAVYARLLLWTHPRPLPVQANCDLAWAYYLNLWRPGKPRQGAWQDHFETAWSMVA